MESDPTPHPLSARDALRNAAREVEGELALSRKGSEQHVRLVLSLIDRLLEDAATDQVIPFAQTVGAGRLCEAAARAAGGHIDGCWVLPERGAAVRSDGVAEIIRLDGFAASARFYARELRAASTTRPPPDVGGRRWLALAERLECLSRL